MEDNRQIGAEEYVFVQTVVVRSGRRSHWLERFLGKGQVQEIPLAGRLPSARQIQPRLQTDGRLHVRPRDLTVAPLAQRGHSTDFWINTLAGVTLLAFLLSLLLLR